MREGSTMDAMHAMDDETKEKYLKATAEAREWASETGQRVYVRWDQGVQDYVLYTITQGTPGLHHTPSRRGPRVPFVLRRVLIILVSTLITWLFLVMVRSLI